MSLPSLINEPVDSKALRENVSNIYNSYKDELGKKVVSIKFTSNPKIKFRIKKYFELLNTTIVLNEFLKDKGINVSVVLQGNIFKKEREIIIRPKVVRAWR